MWSLPTSPRPRPPATTDAGADRPRHRLATALRSASSLAGAVTGPTPGKHVAGELYVDKDGTLWFTVPAPTTADATVVRFVKLAGTPTSGSFHAIDPQRAYDSRQAGYTPCKGLMAPNTNRVISVADGHATDSGTVTPANVVPAGATAVQINVTAANMTGPNFLSVTAGDKTSTEHLTAQLESRRHPDRQLDHGAARRRAARSRCSAATRPAAPTSSSTSSATTSESAPTHPAFSVAGWVVTSVSRPEPSIWISARIDSLLGREGVLDALVA